MKMNNKALWFPALAVLIVFVVAVGLGIIFKLIYDGAGEWGVVGFGSALVVCVPALAAFGQRIVEKN